jgi:hypothetical protein
MTGATAYSSCIGSDTATSLHLGTNGTVRATITSAGLVGIGTSAPTELLHLSGASATALVAASSGVGSIQLTRGTTAFQAYASTSACYIGTTSATDFQLRANNSEAARITSAGLVGIGTSSPQDTLTVDTSIGVYRASSDPTLSFSVGGTVSAPTKSYRLLIDDSDSDKFQLRDDVTPRVTVDGSGNVGIGSTADPGAYNAKLWIDSTTDSTFTVNTTGSASLCQVVLRNSNVNGEARILNATGGPLTFYRSFGNEAARIDTSGRLLVGTSTDLGGGISNRKMQIASDNGGFMVIARDDSSIVSGDAIGAVEFIGRHGGNTGRCADIFAYADANHGTNDYPGRLVFSVTADGEASPTQRLRITNGGDVFIHSGSNFGDTGVSISPGGSGYYSKTAGTGATSRLRFANANGQVGEISTSGSTTTYATSSDYRLKENVTLLTGATDRLKQIPVHRFNFIADPDTTVDGFIAHEAQAVVPECVTGEKDAVDDDGKPVHQGIDQSKLVPLLTAALQEAIGEIESLKARLTAAGI